MATVRLAPIMNALGATSASELIRGPGSPERSLFRQGQVAAIDLFYRDNGLFRGKFGFPLRTVEFRGEYGCFTRIGWHHEIHGYRPARRRPDGCPDPLSWLPVASLSRNTTSRLAPTNLIS